MIAARDWRFRLRAAAFLFLLATFVTPKLHIMRPIYDVVAVMDITGSMNTRDAMLNGEKASRIDLEKRATRTLLAALPCGSRLGLAIFVERRPFLLFEPVETCENFSALDDELASIDWRMGWDSESHIAEGLFAAMAMANGAGADLIFMTDGQETPPLSWTGAPNFAPARGTTNGLIAGLGSHDFSPIPKFDEAGRDAGFFKAGDVPSETGGLFRGHEHLSAVDEPHLRSLATASGLVYVHLTGAGDLLPALSHTVARRVREGAVDTRFIPALLGLFLLGFAEFPARRQIAGKRRLGGMKPFPPDPPASSKSYSPYPKISSLSKR